MSMRKFGNRLIWTHTEESSPEFWNGWWTKSDNLQTRITQLLSFPSLGEYKTPLLRYLPAEGKVLEAGCGIGKVLIPLYKRGYDIEGIEYSRDLVRAIKGKFPDLPIRWGDATAIDKPPDYYAGYISLGVMEHIISGPKPFLEECSRVLKPGGVAIISVPFYDILWRLRSPWLPKGWPDKKSGEHFFQWHFTRSEFVSMVESNGLKVQKTGSSGVRYGALRSIPFWAKLYQMRGGYRIWKALSFVEKHINSIGWMQWVVAHKIV